MTNVFFSVYLWISGEHQYLIYFFTYLIPMITVHLITRGMVRPDERFAAVLQMTDKIRAGLPDEQERLESQD